MPASELLLVPPALLAASSLLTWLPIRSTNVSTRLPAVGTWLSAALLVLWLPQRPVREATYGQLGAGVTFALRLDAVTVTCALAVLVPLGLFLSLRSTRRGDAGFATLAAAGTVLGMEASTLLLSAFCWTATCTLLLLSPRHESAAASARFWMSMMAAAFALLLAAALLIAAGGTSDYAAVPVSALSSAAFVTLAAGALWLAACLPSRSWLHLVWSEAGAVSACLFAAVLIPIGFYLLARSYDMGDGHWPRALLNVLVIAVGVLAQLGAVYRAQRATDLAAYLVEAVPFTTGVAVMSIAFGTATGVVASVVVLATLALLLPMLPLMTYSRSPLVLIGLVVVVGLPPTLTFGSRLLALQASVEAGAAGAVAAIASAVAFLVLLAAGARAARLPAESARGRSRTALPVTLLTLAAVVAGALVGAVVQAFALPVASEVTNVPGAPVTAGYFSVITDSGTWAAFALAVPALAVAIALTFARVGQQRGVRRQHAIPAAFVELPRPRLFEQLRRLRLTPASDPRQELHLPEALVRTPAAVIALLFVFLVVVVTRWSS